jgi:LPS O-antigen subunit length determinant protein (WzzB/FepE family)
MLHKNIFQNDDVDIIKLLKILFNEKWKIIIILFISLISTYFYMQYKKQNHENLYEVRTLYDVGSFSFNFAQPSPTNFNLKFLDSSEKRINPGFLKLNNNVFNINIINEIVRAFNHDKVFLAELIQKKLSEKKNIYNNIEKKSYELAKNFKFIVPNKQDDNYYLSFIWHDVDEGKELFDEALLNVKEKLKDKFTKKVTNYINVYEKNISYNIKELEAKLEIIKQSQTELTKGRIRFLQEQSKIAYDLGIIKPQGVSDMMKLNSNQIPYVKKNSNDISLLQLPIFDNRYFLIGYEAIMNEIEILKKRSNNDLLFLSDSYAQTKLQAEVLKKNQYSNYLKDVLNDFQKEDLKKWSNYNWKVHDTKILNALNNKKILIFGAVLGLLTGIFYVLTINFFSHLKKRYKF